MILEIDNIELSFDTKRILYGIYLKAETGCVTGILGRNGSGKTSLLRVLFGDLSPKYKNIRINGTFQKRRLFKTNKVAYLPQHQLLPNNLKLRDAFKLFETAWTDFTHHFSSFEKYIHSRIKDLSSGERRVVEAYLVLSSKKEIILLDEPFSFVAPLYVEKFKFLIQKTKKVKTIIVTDHFYRDILDVSDNIYFLKNGYSKLIRSKDELEDEGYLRSLSPNA